MFAGLFRAAFPSLVALDCLSMAGRADVRLDLPSRDRLRNWPASWRAFFYPDESGLVMIITLKPETPSEAADALLARILDKGLRALHMPGSDQVVLGALGEASAVAELALDTHPHVESVTPILAPYKLRSDEQTSELQSLMRISYAVFCLKK